MTGGWPLTHATARSIVWQPILAGSAALIAVASWSRLTGADHPLTQLRVGALACVSGVAFVFDDASSVTAAPYPVALRARCASRAVLGLALAAAGWSIAAVIAPLSARDARLLATETIALAGLALAASLVALRRGSRRPGAVAGPMVFGLMLVSTRLGRYAVLPFDVATQVDSNPLARAAVRSLLITSLAVIAAIAATTDPATRRRVARVPTRVRVS